jgi:hypothetical protein
VQPARGDADACRAQRPQPRVAVDAIECEPSAGTDLLAKPTVRPWTHTEQKPQLATPHQTLDARSRSISEPRLPIRHWTTQTQELDHLTELGERHRIQRRALHAQTATSELFRDRRPEFTISFLPALIAPQ